MWHSVLSKPCVFIQKRKIHPEGINCKERGWCRLSALMMLSETVYFLNSQEVRNKKWQSRSNGLPAWWSLGSLSFRVPLATSKKKKKKTHPITSGIANEDNILFFEHKNSRGRGFTFIHLYRPGASQTPGPAMYYWLGSQVWPLWFPGGCQSSKQYTHMVIVSFQKEEEFPKIHPL